MPKNLGLYDNDLSTPRKKDVDTCYSPNNAPPYPVTSVNGQTGAVTVHEVPSVTTADNGKFLRVVNGTWAAVAIADANGVKF